MRIVVMAAIALTLAACTGGIRVTETQFEAGANKQTFEYQALGTLGAPENTADGEAYRRGMLDDWLRINKMCSAGYDIVDRKVTVRSSNALGSSHFIRYTGRCKPA